MMKKNHILLCVFCISITSCANTVSPSQFKDKNFWKSQATKALENKILAQADTISTDTSKPKIKKLNFTEIKNIQQKLNTSAPINQPSTPNFNQQIKTANKNTSDLKNSGGIITKELDKLKQLSLEASNALENALEIAANAIKNIALDAFASIEMVGQIIGQTIVKSFDAVKEFAEKIGSEILDVAKDIIHSIGNELTDVADDVGNFFSNVGSKIACFFGDCPSTSYYIGGVEVSEDCFNTYMTVSKQYNIFTACKKYYQSIVKIFSQDSTSYQINIPFLQSRLAKMAPILAKIATTTIDTPNNSQQLKSIFIQQMQKNLPNGIKLPQNFGLAESAEESTSKISQLNEDNLAKISSQFDLEGKIKFCEDFMAQSMYQQAKIIFENDPGWNHYEFVLYKGNGSFATTKTLQGFPSGSTILAITYTLPKYPTAGNYSNVMDWCNSVLYPTVVPIIKNLDTYIKKIKLINSEIDQTIIMASQKDYINQHFSWIKTQALKIDTILKNKDNGLSPAKQALFKKYSDKINQEIKLIIDNSNGTLTINDIYKMVAKLYKDVKLIGIYININSNIIKQLTSSKESNILNFVNYNKKNLPNDWKSDLEIVLDILNYIDNTIFTDKIASGDTQQEIYAAIERAEKLLLIANNIISNQLILASYLSNEQIVTALLNAGADPNFTLVLPSGTAYSNTAFQSYSNIYSQPYSIENIFDSSNGKTNSQNLMLLENNNNGIYGYTALTAAITGKFNNNIITPDKQTQPNTNPAPQSIYEILKTSAQYSETQIQEINVERGSLLPTQAVGNAKIVSKLLEHGANPNEKSLQNNILLTPLQFAMPLGNIDIIELLVTYGADLKDINGLKGLINILNPNISQPNYISLIKLLIGLGANNINECLNDMLDKDFLNKNFKDIEIDNKSNLKDIVYQAIETLISSGGNPNNNKAVIYNIISSISEKEINIQDAYKLISLLLKHGTICDYQDPISGQTPLMKACQFGFEDIVTLLIQNGALTNIKDKKNKTAINYVLEGGFLYILKNLINANAIVNSESQQLLNTYLISICNPNVKPALVTPDKFINIFDILTNNTNNNYTNGKVPGVINPIRDVLHFTLANPNAVDHEGNSALIYLVQNNNINSTIQENCINILLQKGANPYITNKFGKNALNYAQSGSSIYSQIKYSQSLIDKLFKAIKSNNLYSVQEIVNKNTCINCIDSNGRTPLVIAIINKNSDLIKYLIDQGANLNTIDNKNYTPIMYAIKNGDLDIIKYILQKYPFNITEETLSLTSDKSILKILNEVNSNIEKTQNSDNTALEMAFRLYATQENYAAYSSSSSINYTTLFNAIQANNLTLVQSLISPISDVKFKQNFINHSDSNGNTSLIWAIQTTPQDNPNLALIEFLVQNSPEVINIPDKNNNTPLLLAMSKGANYASIVDYLYAQNNKQLEDLSKKTYVGRSLNPLTSTLTNTDNNNILFYAIENHFTNIATSIVNNPILKNLLTATNNNGDTSATLAAQKGNLTLLKTILTLEPQLLNQPNKQTFTPLSYAIYNNNIDMINYLLTQPSIIIGQIETACFLLSIYDNDMDFFKNQLLCAAVNSSVEMPQLPNSGPLNIWNQQYNGQALSNIFYQNFSTGSNFSMNYNLYQSLPEIIQNFICYTGHVPSVDNNNNPISINCPNPPAQCSS